MSALLKTRGEMRDGAEDPVSGADFLLGIQGFGTTGGSRRAFSDD
jgi:hypothetical protein